MLLKSVELIAPDATQQSSPIQLKDCGTYKHKQNFTSNSFSWKRKETKCTLKKWELQCKKAQWFWLECLLPITTIDKSKNRENVEFDCLT